MAPDRAPSDVSRRKARTILRYRAEDLVLYVFSLAVVGGVAWVAYPWPWARGLSVSCLVYLAVTFVIKHGARLDLAAFAVLGRGLVGYPATLIRNCVRARRRLV